MPESRLTGDELVEVLSTIANPHRLRVLAALSGGRNYVSQLARDLAMSRPLLQMHLKRLEAAGLVESHREISPTGKAMNFYDLAPFSIVLNADAIAKAAMTLSPTPAAGMPARKQR